MAKPPFTLEFYQDRNGDEPVLRWLRDLPPRKRRAMGVALFEILQHDGPNVVGTNFGKLVGGGIFEFRLDQDSARILARKGKRVVAKEAEPAQILLRVFCHAYGDKIVLLLGGYDKGERPALRHQQAQIELAKARLRDWKLRRALRVDRIGYSQ
jgi:phage-related protein